VAERVARGGHDIPLTTIYRRYAAGISNLFRMYMPAVDYWAIYDNSGIDRVKIATGRRGEAPNVYQEEFYQKIKNYVG
jgi:predicted ABC-type ATPase